LSKTHKQSEEEKHAQIVSLHKEIESLRESQREEIASWEVKLDEKQKVYEELEQQLMSKQEEIKRQKKELENHQTIMNENLTLVAQVRVFQQELLQKEYEIENLRNEHNEKLSLLEKTVKDIKKAKNHEIKQKEKEANELLSKIEDLEKILEEKNGQIDNFKENYVHRDEKIEEKTRIRLHFLESQNKELHKTVVELQKKLEEKEGQLDKAKRQWATIDLEKEGLQKNLNKKTEEAKQLTTTVSQLELEVVRAKQDLGEALNAAYLYEQENKRLSKVLEEGNYYPKIEENHFNN